MEKEIALEPEPEVAVVPPQPVPVYGDEIHDIVTEPVATCVLCLSLSQSFPFAVLYFSQSFPFTALYFSQSFPFTALYFSQLFRRSLTSPFTHQFEAAAECGLVDCQSASFRPELSNPSAKLEPT
jgi:hypothetical protein